MAVLVKWLCTLVVSCIIALSALSCNQPFEPRAPLESKLVVFSILSTDRDDQIVRVEQTYMPSGYDAMAYTADGFVPNALVTIQAPGDTYVLRDTTFARQDTSRYKSAMKGYVVKPLAINYGASYRVTVRSTSLGEASTSVVVPRRPTVTMMPTSILMLTTPNAFKDEDEIAFTVDLGVGAKGWIGRFYICYNFFEDGKWFEDRTPVPIAYIFPKVFSTVVYGELTRAGYNNHSASVYRNDVYRKTLVEILTDRHPNSSVKFTYALFELVQVEESLYNYYRIGHASSDVFSVRLDEPLYTNLTGGVGVVGAYTLDSLVQAYPENFPFNRD